VTRRTLLLSVLLAAGVAVAAEAERLDEGRLDPAWFGQPVEFRSTGDFDYVWMKPGFVIKGKKLRVEPWPDPAFLGKERKARDAAMAFELTESMPRNIRTVLRHELKDVAEVVSEGGDLVLTGRLVDYVGKGTMRASNPQATWDMKINDAASGELLVAVHHRRLMSLSTVEERIVMWLEEFGRALRDGLEEAAP
jgi:hypothetical protein